MEQGRKSGELGGYCCGQFKIDGTLGKSSGSGDGAKWMAGSKIRSIYFNGLAVEIGRIEEAFRVLA